MSSTSLIARNKLTYVLLMFLVFGCSNDFSSFENVGSRAEWDKAAVVLAHTPGDEILLGVLHPSAALFERPFDIQKAGKEHREFIRLLREDFGVQVFTVVEVLLKGTIDKNNEILNGRELDNLRNFTKEFIIIEAENFNASLKKEQNLYLMKNLKSLHPRDLVKIILNRPKIYLSKIQGNTGFSAKYELSPQMNLYFLRDQLITTSKGVVVGRMNSPQRFHETKIVSFVLHKLGIKSIFNVQRPGFLEGGDFIPANDTAFIGQGLRTNAEGIQQLLKAKVFGTKRVVIVKDFWKHQSQIHLDTFFNIIDKDLAVIAENRKNPKSQKMILLADVYGFKEGAYRIEKKDINFINYVENRLGFNLISVPILDQINYGVNFLTVAPRIILGIEGVSDIYKDRLMAAGVKATWVNFDNLKGGYGAAHCTTQVLLRIPSN